MAQEMTPEMQAYLNKNTWRGDESPYKRLSDGVSGLYDWAQPESFTRHFEADPRIRKRLRGLGYAGDTRADLDTGATSEFDRLKGEISAANFVNELERSGVPHALAKGLGYLGGTLYQPGSWVLNNLSGSPETFGEMRADWQANMDGVAKDRPGYQTDDELISQFPNRQGWSIGEDGHYYDAQDRNLSPEVPHDIQNLGASLSYDWGQLNETPIQPRKPSAWATEQLAKKAEYDRIQEVRAQQQAAKDKRGLAREFLAF